MTHKTTNYNWPDIDYDSRYGESGKITEYDDVMFQSIRSKEYFIKTKVFPSGEIERRVDLGRFNYEDGILKDEESIWQYCATFAYTPNAAIKDDDTYLGNGGQYTEGETYYSAAESGVVLEYEKGTPYPLVDWENHNKTLFKYASFCSELEENNCFNNYSDADLAPVSNSVLFQKNRNLLPSQFDIYFPEGWWEDPWSLYLKSDEESSTINTNPIKIIQKPAKFKKKFADKITNFNPSTDTLEIDTDSFGIDSSATFASGKNMKEVKKKLAKQHFDFLYDEKKGGLYFNENGADKGFGEGGIIAILKGAPDLTMDNIDLM
jgi:hypothetical protein